MRRADGASAVCLQHGLAGDESPRQCDHQRDATLLHALQQSAAYKTDFLPEQIAELAAEHPNLHAVKESSGDVRRVTAIRALLRDRLTILVGMDDAIVEGVAAGAVGWIAGLVNAFPRGIRGAVRGGRTRRHECRRDDSTTGSCRCCASTPFRSSSSSSSWCRRKSAVARTSCVDRGCRWMHARSRT